MDPVVEDLYNRDGVENFGELGVDPKPGGELVTLLQIDFYMLMREANTPCSILQHTMR